MARWGAKFDKGAASVKGVGYLNAAAASMRRAKLYDIMFGSSATPGDTAANWIVQRCTTAPTATAVTPNALDPADTLARTIVANGAVTVDATLTANAFLLNVPLNQRATFRWVAAPYGELLIPATASNGLMIGVDAATTTVMNAGCAYEEL
jgi:hypothetical protein